MGITSKIHTLWSMSWTQFIYYNFFCSKVIRKEGGFLVPYPNSVIDLGKGAKIVLEDGNFYVNANKPAGSKAEAILKLRENASLLLHHSTTMNYKSTIEIHKDATVEIGSALINSSAVILASKRITMGDEVMISREVYIYDADHHPIINDVGEQINPPRPVVIGNHVWIGLKSTLLRGTKIGDGAVIAANSLVGGKIKAGTMASGNPARSYSEIIWKG